MTPLGAHVTTYNDAVAEARQLVKRSEEDQWRLAELTWEQTQPGKHSQREWAADIGVTQRAVGRWSQIWRYRLEHEHENVGLTYAEADAAIRGSDEGTLRQTESIRTVRNLPPARKAEVARELLTEPEVAERVVYDDTARTNVRQALDRRYEQAPKPYPSHPEPASHDHTVEVLVRLRAISTAIKNATDLILTGPQIDGTEDLLAVLDWQANALSIIRTALTGTDMDAELAKILENGS